MIRSKILLILAMALLGLACGGDGSANSGGANTLPPGPGVMTFTPLELPQVADLEALGAMNPVGHTIPTDHVYFYYADPNHRPWPVLPVVAPGTGKVIWILATPGLPDQKVQVQMTGNFSYYLDHVVLDSTIQVGTTITAGQRVGQTGSGSAAVDLGVLYSAITLTGFVNPARYGETVHADSPFKYFAEPLKTQIYAKVRRSGPDKDGKIDYDVRGRLIGNWFHESVVVADSMGPSAWPKQVAFCPDDHEPTQPRVSIGGFCGFVGLWSPRPGDPDPASVSVASGRVAFHLGVGTGTGGALMIIQMLDDTRIRLQVFPGSAPDSTTFDANALIYIR
ncbi:MAG: hypothetical protein IPP78_09145 [Holophagaceae bacterium]|nr:hypothetical protein [Holophagaceae bacterium]